MIEFIPSERYSKAPTGCLNSFSLPVLGRVAPAWMELRSPETTQHVVICSSTDSDDYCRCELASGDEVHD